MNSQGYYAPGYNLAGPSNDMQGGVGGNNLFTDPVASAAMMYGSSLANQGKDMVNKEVSFIWVLSRYNVQYVFTGYLLLIQ